MAGFAAILGLFEEPKEVKLENVCFTRASIFEVFLSVMLKPINLFKLLVVLQLVNIYPLPNFLFSGILFSLFC